jgi:malate/lactate dehydrogenase
LKECVNPESNIPECYQTRAEAIFIIATNPVDILTHLASEIAAEYGVPHRA